MVIQFLDRRHNLGDLQGQTQWGIDLDPASKEEYLIEFEVPADKNPEILLQPH